MSARLSIGFISIIKRTVIVKKILILTAGRSDWTNCKQIHYKLLNANI